MKRKLVAMLLGMSVVSMTMGVYANEETEVTADSANVSIEKEEVNEQLVWGEVIEVDEASVSVRVGDIPFEEMKTEELGSDEVLSDDAENELQSVPEDIAESNTSIWDLLEFTDEERTIAFSEDMTVYLVNGDSSMQGIMRAAGEYMISEDSEAEDNSQSLTEENAGDNTQMLSEEIAEEVDELETVLEETDYHAIYEGDLVGLILDDEGNAESVLVVLPDSESVETDEEIGEEAEVTEEQ